MWVRATRIGVAAAATILLIAVVVFQDNIFRYSMDPKVPFQTATPPPAPDYAQPEAWAARPETPRPGAPAIFFVHPTTYWGPDAWNAAIDQPDAARRVDDSALPNYAGAFAPLGDLWAPRYRQASLYASLTHRYDARRARTLAYTDVYRAFSRFLAEAPPDSPIVLVGVEQGGLHVLGLLQDVFVTEPLISRLSAAYVIDQATPLDLFDGPLSHLEPCSEPEQRGCVVSWGAEEENDADEIRRFRRRSMVWMGDGRLRATEGRALLCVNPIFGTMGEEFAPRRIHQGGVNATGLGLGVEPAPMAQQTSAQCADGVLLTDRPASPSLREGWSWGGRFKPRTAFLFYLDARRDAARRLGETASAEVAAAPRSSSSSSSSPLPSSPPLSAPSLPSPPARDTLPPLDTVEIERSPVHRVPN